MEHTIELDFGSFKLKAKLFDNIIANKFASVLPKTVDLTGWGNELYGSINIDLGKENPVPEINAGGIAYSERGSYVCIFFGQTPAWPVDHIGSIIGDWEILKNKNIKSVIIQLIE